MPNVYVADGDFDKYVKQTGSVSEAKEAIQAVIKENAPSEGDS